MSTIESGFYSNESGQASPEAYENMLYEEQREESLIEEPLRELNEKERRIVALASEFIIDSPPGQLMEVFNGKIKKNKNLFKKLIILTKKYINIQFKNIYAYLYAIYLFKIKLN